MHPGRPLLILALGVAALLSAAACDDFYADLPTATPGPTATPVPAGQPTFTGTRAEIAQAMARRALADRLGIDPGRPSFGGLSGATWTRANPGCYPPPAGFDGDYLIPGLRVSLVHDGVRYEYHADVPGTTGGLCEQVPQTPVDVGVSLVEEVVRTNVPSLLGDRVVILADSDAARAFAAGEPDAAEIDVEDIDWSVDTLVGTSLPDVPCDVELTVAEAVWDMDTNAVTIGVETAPAEIPEGTVCEGPADAAVWVLIEYPPDGTSFEFQMTAATAETGSP